MGNGLELAEVGVTVAVSVGYLDEMRNSDEESFARRDKLFKQITLMLRKKKLPSYKEPDNLQGKGWCGQVLPAVGIAYLQRLAVYLWRKEELPPTGTQEKNNPLEDDAIEHAYEDCFSHADKPNKKGQRFKHLVCHSSRDGFWLPVEFDEVFREKLTEFASSVWLRKECEDIAKELKLPLDTPYNDPEVLEACDHPGKGRILWKRYGIESYNCLLLHTAATKSIKLGAAICLH